MNTRNTSFLTRVGAVITLAAIFLVPPLAIVRLIGRPWPSWARLTDEFDAGRITTDTTMRIAALASLVVWAWTMLVIIRDVRIVLRERRDAGYVAPAAPGSAGWVQRLVRIALAGSMTTAATVTALAPAASLTLVQQFSPLRADTPAPMIVTELDEGFAVATPEREVTTVVATGRQTPLSLAVDLGDETLRDEIIALNHSPEWSGGVFPAGMEIRVPKVEVVTETEVVASPASGAPATGAAIGGTYVVQPGDGMWDVAEALLGDGSRHRELADSMRGQEVALGVVYDASTNVIHPGWQFTNPFTAQTPTAVAATAPAATTAHIVKFGESLSSIAERHYGSADQWTRLWEANRGAQMSEGRTFDDPNLIMPGWLLQVPDVAPPDVSVPAVAPVVEQPVVEQPVVESLPSDPPTAELPPPDAALPASTLPVTTTPITTTPVTTTPVTTTPMPTAPPATAPANVTPVARPTVTPPADEAPSRAPLGAGLGAAAMLAAGALGVVGARRRQQLRRAGVTARLAERTEPSVELESTLRAVSASERLARLDMAIRVAAPLLTSQSSRVLVALVATDGTVHLVVDGAAVPTSDLFEHDADLSAWVVPATTTLESLVTHPRAATQPSPTLVLLGTSGDDEVYVDLEAMGLLAIDAEPEQAALISTALTASLAVSPLLEAGRLITAGFDTAAHLSNLNAEHAGSPAEALAEAVATLGSTATMTKSGSTTFALRSRERSGEAWEPVVVSIAGHDVDHDVAGQMMTVAGAGGHGLAIVVDRYVDGAHWVLRPVDGQFRLLPIDLPVTPIGLTTDEVVLVQRLIDEASEPLVEHAEVVPLHVDNEDPAPWIEPEWSLVVRLLGDVDVVDVDGQSAPFERSKALELVVWLSQHREFPTRSKARAALWELDVRDATFANVVSDARRAMARLVPPPEGEEWIGRTLTEHLPLHTRVLTDAELLQARLDYVRGLPAMDVVEVLRPGLDMVSGLPFAGTSYLWTDAEGLPSALTLLATGAATVLGQAYLALGDTDGVFWATGQGLKVLAGHEELIGLRMRAHANAGDLAGVRREWEAYERALHADQWSSGEPSPKLVALRKSLLAPSLAG
jgi:LysM repeat protein